MARFKTLEVTAGVGGELIHTRSNFKESDE